MNNKKKINKRKKMARMLIFAWTAAFAAILMVVVIIVLQKKPEDTRETTIPTSAVSNNASSVKITLPDLSNLTSYIVTEDNSANSTEETTDVCDETSEETTESEQETETVTETETQTETESETEPTEETTKEAILIEDVAFIGDSRTLSMATGARLAYALVPDDCVYATWGGQLIDESAFENAKNAGSAMPKVAIFWYGINDVQVNPDRDNADGFVANYDAVVKAFLENNNGVSELYFLSILDTTVEEKDYYEGQEENVRKYNEKLSEYCEENGYTYVDIAGMLTGPECYAPDDNIHFSLEWYRDTFLPIMKMYLNIIN